MAEDRNEYMRGYRAGKKELQTISAPNVEFETVTETVTNACEHLEPQANTRKGIAIFLLIFFFAANTSYLVYEQVSFYALKGRSMFYAVSVSVLCETAVLILSFYYARTTDFWVKLRVGISLALTIACILCVIFLGIDFTENSNKKNAEIAELMRSEIATIKKQVEEHPKLENKLVKKEEALGLFLKGNDVSFSVLESFVMIALRILSLSWNVIFATLLAVLLSKNQSR